MTADDRKWFDGGDPDGEDPDDLPDRGGAICVRCVRAGRIEAVPWMTDDDVALLGLPIVCDVCGRRWYIMPRNADSPADEGGVAPPTKE